MLLSDELSACNVIRLFLYCQAICVLLVVMFLRNEFSSLMDKGMQHLASIWNIVEVINFFFVFFMILKSDISEPLVASFPKCVSNLILRFTQGHGRRRRGAGGWEGCSSPLRQKSISLGQFLLKEQQFFPEKV